MAPQPKHAGTLLTIGGVLFVLSFAPEAFGLVTLEREGQVTNVPLAIFFVSLMSIAAILLAIGLWGIRTFNRTESRSARIGLYLSIAACTCFALQGIAMAVSYAQTGRTPDIFVFFLFGLLFSLIGPLLFGAGIRRWTWLGWGSLLPFAVALGAVLAFIDVDPVHDIGLTVLGLSWAAFGASMLLRRPARVEAAQIS